MPAFPLWQLKLLSWCAQPPMTQQPPQPPQRPQPQAQLQLPQPQPQPLRPQQGCLHRWAQLRTSQVIQQPACMISLHLMRQSAQQQICKCRRLARRPHVMPTAAHQRPWTSSVWAQMLMSKQSAMQMLTQPQVVLHSEETVLGIKLRRRWTRCQTSSAPWQPGMQT